MIISHDNNDKNGRYKAGRTMFSSRGLLPLWKRYLCTRSPTPLSVLKSRRDFTSPPHGRSESLWLIFWTTAWGVIHKNMKTNRVLSPCQISRSYNNVLLYLSREMLTCNGSIRKTKYNYKRRKNMLTKSNRTIEKYLKAGAEMRLFKEIGRASCRERVYGTV